MDLNASMVEFARDRLARLGKHESGLYGYYAHLASKGTMLRPEEYAVADYVDAVSSGPILEICAGAAQLGHLLATRGHDVTAVEIDPRRHAFAVDLGQHLGSTCKVIRGRWQDMSIGDYGLIVTINAISSMVAAEDITLLAHSEIILRPRQFGSGLSDVGRAARQVHGDIYHYR